MKTIKVCCGNEDHEEIIIAELTFIKVADTTPEKVAVNLLYKNMSKFDSSKMLRTWKQEHYTDSDVWEMIDGILKHLNYTDMFILRENLTTGKPLWSAAKFITVERLAIEIRNSITETFKGLRK